MSVYQGKVIELLAIEKENEKVFLRIKLSFETEVELFWEIDRDTAENLITISNLTGNHKYRLSLHTTLDPHKGQFISSITKTYRDKSERIGFVCSVGYKNNLDSIKNTQSMNDLIKLPFLSIEQSAIDGEKIEQKNEVVIPKAYTFPFKWVYATLIGAILVLLFGFFNNIYLHKNTMNDTTIAKAQVKTAEVQLDTIESVVAPVSELPELVKDDTVQLGLPYLEIEDSVAFSLPAGNVALTFDDGPSKYTEEIVDILKHYKVGGTFFFIGMNVKKHPDAVRYVQSNGYSIGSHSMNHPKMSELPYEKQVDELIQSTKAIEEITNERVILFRPPYGAFNKQTKEVLYDYQEKMILWNIDPKDWMTRDAEKIFNYINKSDGSGAIIILHESQAVIDALPRIIEYLQEENLNIVSIQ
ncbi:polysaccharide deacetylase family protein [Bacillus sp. FJAT-49732]|uniref:Polysaccharide deacetylase family protein n=1 Tax=Lederbergia citrisecunda TaxID=2833583 RepID=A0A942YMY8_9BACI|nr:polysaccharide deacetylase family protein [Lederbergia citrisecunda]MBS4201185.1 polysaccharide deacetylase family protein [Lederbergia citrisecunda]